MIYIGRADLDHSEIEDLIDGENLFSWRLFDRIQNKIYLFTHRSPLDKIQMMDALEYERAYVQEKDLQHSPIPSLKKQSKKTSSEFFLKIFFVFLI